MASKIVDNLDDISNAELRVKLQECGFPNMPITDTSRKVLIKKLRNAMDSGKSNASSRRETINIVKYSSGEESETGAKKKDTATTRRQTTVGVTTTTTKTDTESSKSTGIQNKKQRRSSGTTPTPQPPFNVGTKLMNDNENSDDEFTIIPINNRKKSRSPSLAKSDVVTTSYKQSVRDDIIEVEDENNEYYNQYQQQKQHQTSTVDDYLQKLQRNNSTGSPGKTIYHKVTPEKSYDENEIYFNKLSEPIDNDLKYGITDSNTNYKTEVRHPSTIEPTNELSSKRYTSIGSNTKYTSGLFRHNEAANSISGMAAKETSGIRSKNITRRYTGASAPARFGNSSYYDSAKSLGFKDQEDANDHIVNDYETPYLSEFTRRLTNLTVPPLTVTNKQQQLQIQGNQYYHRNPNNIYSKENNAIFKQYQPYFITIFVILCLIFIYVFIFSSN